MAFMNQEKKKVIAPAIKAVLKKFGMKGSISVSNYSTLVVTVSKGPLDFNDEKFSKNYYGHKIDPWKESDDPRVQFVNEMIDAMNGKGTEFENFDKSDAMSDYFHVGWYTDLSFGKWDKPYEVVEA